MLFFDGRGRRFIARRACRMVTRHGLTSAGAHLDTATIAGGCRSASCPQLAGWVTLRVEDNSRSGGSIKMRPLRRRDEALKLCLSTVETFDYLIMIQPARLSAGLREAIVMSKILYIEDTENNPILVMRRLEKKGHQVITAAATTTKPSLSSFRGWSEKSNRFWRSLWAIR